MFSPSQQKWEGRWERLVGRVKSLWGGLIADEHLQLEGELEAAIGARQERAGEAREEFYRRLDRRVRC